MLRKQSQPLHERIKPLSWLRGPLRRALFGLLYRAFETDDGRTIASRSLRGLLRTRPEDLNGLTDVPAPPYTELGTIEQQVGPRLRSDPIFVTARFRTGSTLLWNLFRNIEGVTAYYEPFNERRWFDPRTRGDRKDVTHRNVADYWWEYEHLEELGEHYREDWISKNLYMDKSAWNPDMKRYVEDLIEKAPGRPVFQFNRIDFRLGWFRHTFPHAKIVHLYRHPREEWCSALMDPTCFPKDGAVADFARVDKFYLLIWVRDLKYHFPFLDEGKVEHPYELFYFIWKLSYLFGMKYADYSISFEQLIDDPRGKLEEMFAKLGVRNYDLDRLLPLIVNPAQGKWREYAEDDWFSRHEARCESILDEFLGKTAVELHRDEGSRTNGQTRQSDPRTRHWRETQPVSSPATPWPGSS